METRTRSWGKMVAKAMVQAIATMQGVVFDARSHYDAISSYSDSPRRDLLVQRTLERMVGRRESPQHGSCQFLKTNSPPSCKAEPYTLPENLADSI
ncbi:hypothetical protein WISP_142768 [Willisornis vidua]|uniref:Uncharacterized protein n=1 Tax=Willisornis vidua TaxID=1566151 RepID=A0ABQ9CMK9_9PASS|nr:hypothetical protein WISP_142768 [Willisornis vidua]